MCNTICSVTYCLFHAGSVTSDSYLHIGTLKQLYLHNKIAYLATNVSTHVDLFYLFWTCI